MPMDIELQQVGNPDNKITVLYPHWRDVLKPQGNYEPVNSEDEEIVKQLTEEESEE